MLKIGIFGSNHLAALHTDAIGNIEGLEIAGFYDTDGHFAGQDNGNIHFPNFNSLTELLEASDIIDIVSTDIPLFSFASKAIKESKHLFIEKPLVSNLKEVTTLLSLASEANVKVQIGYIERFNPALQAVLPYLKNPMFIESQRLVPFSSVHSDASVVSDLMVHDIDIILSVVKANIKRVHATGVKVFGNSPDIVNARLEFDNGTTASLTANRISSKDIRFSKFYQPQSRVQVDFLKLSAKILKQQRNKFSVNDIKIFPRNKIETAIRSFQQAILNNTEPLVSIDDSYRTLRITEMITNKIQLVRKAV